MLAWQLVLIQVVTFAALIAVLRALFYRQLNSALRRLQTLQEEAMAKESELKEELARAKLERAAEVEQGKEEAQILVEAAKREADIVRANIEEIAKQDVQKILERGQEELTKSRLELLNNMEVNAVRLSLELLKYTFSQQAREAFQHHLIQELITEISGLDKAQFSVKAEAVTVTSSSPLTEEERTRLSRALSEKLGGAVTLKEVSDPELITGLVIQIGALVIDGSLKNKLRKALPMLRAQREGKVSDTLSAKSV